MWAKRLITGLVSGGTKFFSDTYPRSFVYIYRIFRFDTVIQKYQKNMENMKKVHVAFFVQQTFFGEKMIRNILFVCDKN